MKHRHKNKFNSSPKTIVLLALAVLMVFGYGVWTAFGGVFISITSSTEGAGSGLVAYYNFDRDVIESPPEGSEGPENPTDTGIITPNADGTTSWTRSGCSAGSAYSCITAQDSNYLEGDNSVGFFRLSTIPDIEKVIQVQVFVEHRETQNRFPRVYLYDDNESTQYGTPVDLPANQSQNFRSDSATFSSLSLTQNQLDNMSVRLECSGTGGGQNRRCYIDRVYAVVTYEYKDASTGNSANGIMLDSTAYSNHGIIAGAEPTPGRTGQGLSMSGLGVYARADAAPHINNLSAFSVSAWIKPNSLGQNNHGAIISKSSGEDDHMPVGGWSLSLSDSVSNTISFSVDFDNNHLQRVAAANSIRIGEWNHVLVTWDGGRSYSGVHIYINGEEVAYSWDENGEGLRETDATSHLYIGNNPALNEAFDGIIDEVRIHNRVVSLEEIDRVFYLNATAKIVSDSNRETVITATQKEPANLSSGLMLHWTFDKDDFILSDAAAIKDISGNNLHGTLQGGVTQGLGKIGQGAWFDGVNRGFLVTNSPWWNLAGATRTFSFWIKVDSRTYPGCCPSIFDYLQGGNTGSGWALMLGDAPNNHLLLDHRASPNLSSPDRLTVQSTMPMNDNLWHHVVITMDGSMARMYIDGELNVSDGYSNLINRSSGVTDDMRVGHMSEWTDVRYKGFLDDMRIYNRVLSIQEILSLYDLGVGAIF